jgi:hypothetical protein
MATQTIGAVRVAINNQDQKVRSLSYGQPLELKKALDLSIVTPQDGEAITYDAATGNFAVTQVAANTANIANTALLVAGGTF